MISEVSEAIQVLLSSALYPTYITSKDRVQLCIPQQKQQDYQIGIYLYDISTDSINEQRYASVQGSKWIFPAKIIKISYLIFVNEVEQFGGYNKQQEEVILEVMLQTMHDTWSLHVQGQELTLQFEQLSLDVKFSLWQGFQLPLQPALYVNVSPIFIPSQRTESASLVQDMTLVTKRKE